MAVQAILVSQRACMSVFVRGLANLFWCKVYTHENFLLLNSSFLKRCIGFSVQVR